ncbi:hypothetical protein [Pseudomonas sp. NPDC099000]|uniref:hypothetical protein n=1 Tax=Pseudomonas sp. NPDC099000 TaxID=3364488 RepID=UPI00383A3899
MSAPILQDVHALPIHGAAPGHAPLYTGVIGFAGAPLGHRDPLLPAVKRFVAARPFTGPGALMRRYGIGLERARWLLVVLEEWGVVRGHWGRLVAAGSLGGVEVYSFRMYRVQAHAWRSLQGGGA